jgi:hypothetical protein
MSLLDLKTDLKSLKYGQDQPGGGNSRQPYIQTDINTVDTDFNRLRLTKFDDGLVRGGIIGALNASVVDTLRIGKFFLDAPKGPLFITKQIGLQLSNPRLEVPKNPLNIAAGAPSNTLSVGTNGLLQPTRIYNLGVNTLLQVPLNALGGHIVRHGLFPIQSDASKYEAIVTANNDNLGLLSNNPSKNNRLVSLKDKFQLGDRQVNKSTINNNFLNQINTVLSAASALLGGPSIPSLNINKTETVIDDYLGGPGSVYGIGRTLIKRTSNTEDGIKINLLSQFSRDYAGKTRDDKGSPQSIILKSTFDYGLSNRKQSTLASRSFSDLPNQIPNPNTSLLDYNISNNRNPPKSNNSNPLNTNDLVTNGPSSYPNSQGVTGLKSLSLPNLIYSSGISSSYSDIKVATDNLITSSSNGFGIYNTITDVNTLSAKPDGVLPTSPRAINTSPTYKNGYGDVVKISGSWNRVTRELRVGSGRQDQINLTPIFDGDKYFGEDKTGTHNIRDLVKFRIQAVNTDSPDSGRWMVFRAYLTDLSDDTSAEWSDVKYAGRGDKFYIYTGFTRKISIGFKIAALSVDEMQFIYQKLNFLMSNTMPDYSNELMRGPLVRMTVGNYIDSQLGTLNQVSIKPDKESPWEIALDEPEGGTKQLILPHVLDVSLSFTPIGSETAGSNLIAKKSENISHIAQNNTGDIKTLQYIK